MRYVRYIGLSHERQISAIDWRRAGIQGETVVWSAFNGFAVPLDQFTDEQIRKAIEPDVNFVITGEGEDGDEEFVPQPKSMAMTPAQAAQNDVDVVAYVNGDDDVSTDDSGPVPAPGGAAPTSTTTNKGAGSDSPGTTAH